jgi:hypothetical protein
VIICRRQQFGFFVGYPLVAFTATTVGAMAIATRMKLVMLMPAVRALAAVMMHSDARRVAVAQFFEDVATVLIAHSSTCLPKNHLLELLGYLSHF